MHHVLQQNFSPLLVLGKTKRNMLIAQEYFIFQIVSKERRLHCQKETFLGGNEDNINAFQTWICVFYCYIDYSDLLWLTAIKVNMLFLIIFLHTMGGVRCNFNVNQIVKCQFNCCVINDNSDWLRLHVSISTKNKNYTIESLVDVES